MKNGMFKIGRVFGIDVRVHWTFFLLLLFAAGLLFFLGEAVVPLVSLSASLLIAFVLYRLWLKSGRPRGVSKAAARAHTTELANGNS